MRHFRSTDKRLKSLSDWPSMLLTFTVCLLCWVLCYVCSTGSPPEESPETMPLWALAGKLLNRRLGACLAGLFVTALAAYVMQRISDMEMLIRERTRLPFLLFLLLVSTNAGLLPVREVSVVLICLVFAVYELFHSYQCPELTGKFFNIGILVGVAGLLMPQAIWFIPLFWTGMFRFRTLTVRNFMASLTGMLILYWFLLAWCVWKHDYSMFSMLYDRLADFRFPSAELFRFYQAGSAVLLSVLAAAFFYVRIDAFNNSVRVRQMLAFLSNMAAWSFGLIVLYGRDPDPFLAVIYLPSSVLIAHLLENSRRIFRFVLYYFMLLTWLASFLLRLWSF
ncbi:MAG: hypothetical protein LBL07_09985 [Tannerella sp.]|nr:hypothetical protein [Tannerella sp.]